MFCYQTHFSWATTRFKRLECFRVGFPFQCTTPSNKVTSTLALKGFRYHKAIWCWRCLRQQQQNKLCTDCRFSSNRTEKLSVSLLSCSLYGSLKLRTGSLCVSQSDLHNSVCLTADPRANAPVFQCARAATDKIQAEVSVCEQSCVCVWVSSANVIHVHLWTSHHAM